ncbi:MAG: RNA-directed DNA polymerase [Muribaculaceae bacterium]|nr:RNA-directed DNA polymerase [Muribaculaceae bacterium]
MEKLEIRNSLIAIKSVEDLAELLNNIKNDKFKTSRHKITDKQLKYYSNNKYAPKRYRTFHIRKKNGGLREIKAPCYQLNIILRMLNIAFESVFEPDSVAMGFAPGRSVVNNAQMHIRHNYVFNLDLKDFFLSIPQARVWKRLQLAPFNFSLEIANVVAGLCCSYNEERDQNVLPQGAPTSPLLTNAICGNLDRKMKGLAKRFGLHYSRYADDMTFSSMHNVYKEGGEFRTELLKIISEQGFTVNDKKTRLHKAEHRQEVTGLTVNTKANVSRKYIQELRWILNVWDKYGYAKAYALFYPRYKSEMGHIKKGEPVMENVIGGKLDYLRMVRGATNPAYKKLQERFDKLQQVVFLETEEEQPKTQKFMYVQPYTMTEFKEYFLTEVSLIVTKKGKLVGKCTIAGMEKNLSISHAAQDFLCPKLNLCKEGDSVVNEKLNNCYVILCRAKGKNYWMIGLIGQKRNILKMK